MNYLIAASSATAFALYAAATILLPQERSRRRGYAIAAIATVALLLHCLAIKYTPAGYWSALAGAVVAVMAIAATANNYDNHLPTTGFTIAAASLLSLFTPYGSNAVSFHLLLTYVACGFLSLAAIQAIAMAVQEQQIRARRPNWALRLLAPLNDMERLLFEQITLGFFTLSLGLVAGIAAQYEMLGDTTTVRKLVLSLMVWLTFGTLLWGRRYRGWRARTAVLWTLGGCTILGMAYVASHLAASGSNL
ncbi:MAG: cytochrome C assembly family protein [Candidatus Porifericomitaceae bacterium WSBS_2022_MAG_OTU9]